MYSKRITDPEAFAKDLGTESGLIELTRVVAELESQSINAALELRMMHEAIEMELLENLTTGGLMNSKIDQTVSRMGVAPEDSNSRWSASTLWGTVSEMASFLETLVEGVDQSRLSAEQEARVGKLVSDLV